MKTSFIGFRLNHRSVVSYKGTVCRHTNNVQMKVIVIVLRGDL